MVAFSSSRVRNSRRSSLARRIAAARAVVTTTRSGGNGNRREIPRCWTERPLGTGRRKNCSAVSLGMTIRWFLAQWSRQHAPAEIEIEERFLVAGPNVPKERDEEKTVRPFRSE